MMSQQSSRFRSYKRRQQRTTIRRHWQPARDNNDGEHSCCFGPPPPLPPESRESKSRTVTLLLPGLSLKIQSVSRPPVALCCGTFCLWGKVWGEDLNSETPRHNISGEGALSYQQSQMLPVSADSRIVAEVFERDPRYHGSNVCLDHLSRHGAVRLGLHQARHVHFRIVLIGFGS